MQRLLGVSAPRMATAAAPLTLARRCVSLQSEKPCEQLADKIVRGKLQDTFYAHPSYVMAREKMLYTIWQDAGVFTLTSYVFVPFFAVAYFFKA